MNAREIIEAAMYQHRLLQRASDLNDTFCLHLAKLRVSTLDHEAADHWTDELFGYFRQLRRKIKGGQQIEAKDWMEELFYSAMLPWSFEIRNINGRLRTLKLPPLVKDDFQVLERAALIFCEALTVRRGFPDVQIRRALTKR